MSHPDYEWMRELNLPLVTQQIHSNFDPAVFEAFSYRDKMLRAVCEFDAETMNGGIDQYFWNQSGDHCFQCLEAFSLIGATRAQSYLKKAMEFFPQSSPALATLERREQVEDLWKSGTNLNEVLYYDVEPDLCAKLRVFYEAQGTES